MVVDLDLSPEPQVVKVGLMFGLTLPVELLFFYSKRSFSFLAAAKRGIFKINLFDIVK